jgi:hypothetical protein
MIPPYIDHRGLFDKFYEWLVNFWALSLFFALLPIIAAVVVALVGAPIFLGYIVWSIAFEIYRHYVPVATPELPQQLTSWFF